MFKKTLALLAATAILAVGMGTVAMAEGETPCDHQWFYKVTEQPTCTFEGAAIYVCTECGENKAAEAPGKLDHKVDYTKVIEHKDPTCLDKGYDKYQCTTCPSYYETKDIDALGHTEVIVWGKIATCTEDGETPTTVCSVCKTVIKDSTVVPALGHQWGEYEETKAPTCTAKGVKVRTCGACGDQEKASIPMVDHTPVVVPAVDPTCTATGLTEGSVCDVCGTVLVAQETVKKLAHTPVVVPAVPATCTATGLTEGSVCDVCGKVLVAQTDVDMISHAWGEYETIKEPTCTEKGVKVRTCGDCGKEQKAGIAMVPHAYEEQNVKPATCLKAGSKDLVCACGDTQTGVVIDMLDHRYIVPVETKATCTKPGKIEYFCVNGCNRADKTLTKTIPAINHEYKEEVAEVPATCTEDGTVGGWYCPDCDKYSTDGKNFNLDELTTIQKLGHNYDSAGKIVIKATCIDPNKTIIPCTNGCGTSKVTVGKVNPNAHVWGDVIPAQEPTCTEIGWANDYQECTLCNAKSATYSELPATGHKAAKTYTVEKDATCEVDGTKVKYCTVCEEPVEKTRQAIPALGHNYVTITAVEPTCTEVGYTEGAKCDREVCDVEGGKYLVEPKEVPATGHDYDDGVVTKEATCTEKGEMTFTCANCGDTYTEEIPVIAHTAATKYTVTIKATCTEPGRKVKLCTVCGNEIEDTVKMIPALGHQWGQGEVTKEATCVEMGEATFTCTRKNCDGIDNTKTEEIPFRPHTEKVVPGKAATCTETGLTDGVICEVCDAILTAQEEIPMAAHTEETVPGKAATCTETGLTDGVKCAVCGETLKAQEVIPMAAHTEETVPGKAATCTETGLTDGVKCAVCGEILTAQDVIPALGHNYVDGECERCGQEDPDCKHAKTEVIPGKAATCTEAGLTDGLKCVKCGEIVKVQEVIPALGHVEETVPGKAATCTETGLTDGVKCAVCGVELKAQEVIEAKGHEMVTVVKAVEPTCTTDGCTEGLACANCDLTVESEIIPRLGHKAYYVAPVAPTCVKDGHGELWACETCGIALTEYDVYMAKGKHTTAISHNDEYHYEYCVVCGDILNYGAHELETTVSGGKIHIACKWCDYEVVHTPAYNYDAEYHYEYCADCGDILRYGAHELVTTVSDGKVHTACKWCAYEDVKEIFANAK